MTQVYVKYNPYRLEASMKVNGRDVSTDSILYKLTKGKRLQEWAGNFPKMLREELNTVDFDLEFCGMDLDWDDFKDAFDQAQKNGIVKKLKMQYIASKSDEDINDKIVNIFHDLQNGPIDDFRDEKLTRAFENINNSVFPVNVIATMSSGKSTLINALLRVKLMPSKNEACTAIITEILDNDETQFSALAYNEQNQLVQEVPDLTYSIMEELNSGGAVHKIAAEGNIPFLDARSTALALVDTPGPNNAQNQAHKNTTYSAINNDSNNMILYVLNGTQLGTNDDSNLLKYVADQIRKGGKQMRDRFLFVINKMDQFNPEEESIENVILAARRYLSGYGIDDPQLFPCSAFTALNIRTYLNDVDIDHLTRAEEKKLPIAARDTLSDIDRFIDFPSMHLEQYSTLSPSAQQELNYRLSQSIEQGDIKEQALIHSGIYSIEAAIKAYVKKYAKTKKIKDLVESFQEVLESSRVLEKAKEQVASHAEVARACAERAAAVQRKIADGKEAEAFRKKIDALNPMPEINAKADKLKELAHAKASQVFKPYGDTIHSRDEAKHLIAQFTITSSDAMAELTSELQSTIEREIVKTGKQLLLEYQDKLTRFDNASNSEKLDFCTADLVKGALQNIRESASEWTTDEFSENLAEDTGTTEYETKVYYEKVGQEEEEVVSGSHEEKIGTRKVKIGSHQERTGTRKVRNPAKRWWKIFTPSYIDEDVYTTVDDYADEDVYKTVLEYKTIIRDVFEERTERIEHYHVETGEIMRALTLKMRMNLDDGLKEALRYAANQVTDVKKQFAILFDKLDKMIAEKYDELKRYSTEQNRIDELLAENKSKLDWIEANMIEINEILEM